MNKQNGDPSNEQNPNDDGHEGSSNEQGDNDSSDNKEKPTPEQGLFFNPNEVPEELKPAFKKMQASFTRKMQQAGLSVRKAQAFDELSANPEFQAWLDEQRSGGSRKRGKSKSDDDDDDGEKTPSGGFDMTKLEEIVDRAVSKNLAPIVQGENRKRAQAEWDKLIEVYPQAENYKDEIAEAMEASPGLSYAKAFKQVAFDDAVSAKAKKKITEKKEANTDPPSKLNPGEKPPGKAKTIHEAAEMARKQMRERK